MNILIIFSLIISHIHHLIGMGKWLRSDEATQQQQQQWQQKGSDEESDATQNEFTETKPLLSLFVKYSFGPEKKILCV